MVIHFEYEKKQVMSALRHHFISRPEIKILLVIVNLFTILSAVLFYMHKIQPDILSAVFCIMVYFAPYFLDYSSPERVQALPDISGQFHDGFK